MSIFVGVVPAFLGMIMSVLLMWVCIFSLGFWLWNLL